MEKARGFQSYSKAREFQSYPISSFNWIYSQSFLSVNQINLSFSTKAFNESSRTCY